MKKDLDERSSLSETNVDFLGSYTVDLYYLKHVKDVEFPSIKGVVQKSSSMHESN